MSAKRRGKNYVPGQNAIVVTMPTAEIEAFIDQLGVDVADAIRPAAQAAAQVLYDEVKNNVAQIRQHTGNLYKSIYQKYSPELSVPGKVAFYRVSWNTKKAPHGGLIEGGHLQRYRYYQNDRGEVQPMVRPGMDGRKKPSKDAPQSVKDAYYVPLDTPKQIPGKFFVRRAIDKFPQAIAAAELELLKRINGMTS